MRPRVILLLLTLVSYSHVSWAAGSPTDNKEWRNKLSQQQRNAVISLELLDTPLTTLFNMLAQQLRLNVVISDEVTASASIQLNDVRCVDVMQSIAKSHHLKIQMQHGILRIEPSNEQSEVVPRTKLELVPLNFANASDVAQQLTNEHLSLASPVRSISVDERTNALIISDTPDKLSALKGFIKKLDKPLKQVMIEARMVSLKTNITEEFGVRWGASANGLAAAAEDSAEFINGMKIELPATQPAASLGLNVARLDEDLLLDLELTALERENKGEIIASPRIFTADKQTAYIEQGTEIPYIENAESGATAVKFKKAVMGLHVTPHITPNGHISLQLKITQNTRGDTVSTPTGPAVAIDTQEMATQVVVGNKKTIVLGGIFQTVELNDNESVPILSALPLVGRLFKHQLRQKEKRELVIFVTPTILNGS